MKFNRFLSALCLSLVFFISSRALAQRDRTVGGYLSGVYGQYKDAGSAWGFGLGLRLQVFDRFELLLSAQQTDTLETPLLAYQKGTVGTEQSTTTTTSGDESGETDTETDSNGSSGGEQTTTTETTSSTTLRVSDEMASIPFDNRKFAIGLAYYPIETKYVRIGVGATLDYLMPNPGNPKGITDEDEKYISVDMKDQIGATFLGSIQFLVHEDVRIIFDAGYSIGSLDYTIKDNRLKQAGIPSTSGSLDLDGFRAQLAVAVFL